MPNIPDDAWIDLCYLSAGISDGKDNNTTIFIYDFTAVNDIDGDTKLNIRSHTIIYMMRKAIRAVGHKIKKINCYWCNKGYIETIDFVTDVTKDEKDYMMKVWEQDVDNVVSDIEEESDDEDEDEEEENDNTEEKDDLNADPI